MRARLTYACALALTLAAPVQANQGGALPPLSQVPQIDEGLLAVALADELRRVCDGVEARWLLAYATLNRLRSTARDLGYTEAQIDAHVNSAAEQARMEQIGQAWLRARGVTPGDHAAYCPLARAEIEQGSAVGRLLWAR